MSRLKRANQDMFCLGLQHSYRDVEGERNLNGCNAKTWNTRKQKLLLKAAASSARPCGDERRRRRRWPGPGAAFFAISPDLLAAGQDVWSQLIPAHPSPARGCWHCRPFKCSFVAACFCWLFMEPKCWKWILRKLLKVSGGCSPACLCWNTMIRGVLPHQCWVKSGKLVAPVGRWFLTWPSVELVTPSAQSPEGWQGEGISQHLNSCSLFLIPLIDNDNGWIEAGPDSQDRE